MPAKGANSYSGRGANEWVGILLPFFQFETTVHAMNYLQGSRVMRFTARVRVAQTFKYFAPPTDALPLRNSEKNCGGYEHV